MRLIIHGATGRMGKAVTELAEQNGHTIAAKAAPGYMQDAPDKTPPEFCALSEAVPAADCVIDFSNHAAAGVLVRFCRARNLPVVIATTGHTPAEKQAIVEAAGDIPVFFSANMSIGVAVLADLARRAAAALPDADIEIVEIHHNQKMDVPSGTALMLADAVSEALPYDAEYVYDRHERRMKRPQNEIGIHSVRGGTIVGEHEVLFAGRDELIEIRHVALSREVFAVGAVDAAAFLGTQKQPGMYDMSDVIAAK